MAIVGAGLIICDTVGCGTREICAMTMTKNGLLAEKVPGWVITQKRLVGPNESNIESHCPKCVAKATTNGVGASTKPDIEVLQ